MAEASALERYQANYGQRLQSLLQAGPPVTDTTSVLGRSGEVSAPTPAVPTAQGSPDVQTFPVATPQAAPEESALEEPAKQGTSMRSLYKGLPAEEQKKQADALEDALKKGGSSIDKAYDDLIKQMGTRPDEGLSREEKGMLIMEFGLNLMANSSNRAYGDDLGGAVGAAGLNSMDSYQRTKGARARRWDQQKSALEQGRVQDKLGLSQIAAEEEIKADAELASTSTFKPDRDQFVGADGYYYETVDGKASRLLDENGDPIKAPPKEVSGSTSERVFEFDHRKKAYMESRGYDWDGNPLQEDLPKLTGEQLRKMRREATEFAGDTKNASMSEEEVLQQAMNAVDDQMRFAADLYRDYSPAQFEAERRRLVQERIKEIRKSREGGSALEERPAPSFGPASSPFAQSSTPPASVLVVGKARRIRGFEGRWTLVNGKPTRVD